MSKRTLPYGYMYNNGTIVIEKTASDIVKYIFEQYKAQKSMLDIADMLNHLHIEYSSGVIGWNKARIKRILEDKRYLGDDKYPVIISPDLFESVSTAKANRNNQKFVNREENIYQIHARILCPCCKSIMKRRIENRTKIREHWKCSNPDCRKSIAIKDEEFLSQIHGLIDRIIINPKVLNCDLETPSISAKVEKQEREIARLLEYQQMDGESVKQKILELFTIRYGDINNQPYETQRLISIYKNQKKADCFPIELFNRTVDIITFGSDNTVMIGLTNGQIIKEGRYAAS